jgi:hypothetical protein
MTLPSMATVAFMNSADLLGGDDLDAALSRGAPETSRGLPLLGGMPSRSASQRDCQRRSAANPPRAIASAACTAM